MNDLSKFSRDLARQLNKKLGKAAMPIKATAINDLTPDELWVPSDFLDVNRVTGGSLFKFAPAGNVITLAGTEASGKSLVAQNLLKNAKENGFFPILVETEKALSYSGAQSSGMLSQPEMGGLVLQTGYVETCLVSLDTVISKCVESGVQPIIVLDSLGNLDIEKTVKDVLKGKLVLDQGQFQRSVKIMLKHLTNLCSIHDIPMVIVTHIYFEPGMYGGKKIYGGQHLKYMSNTILLTSTVRRKDKTGYDLKLTSLKNRVCPPFQEAKIDIDIRTSEVKRFAGLIDTALDLELVEMNGNYIYVPHLDAKLYKKEIEGKRSADVFTQDFLLELEDKIIDSGYDTISFSDDLAMEVYDNSIEESGPAKKDDKGSGKTEAEQIIEGSEPKVDAAKVDLELAAFSAPEAPPADAKIIDETAD